MRGIPIPQVTVDASTAAKLYGLGQYLELYDDSGNRLGHFEPDEKSPAFREWLRSLDHGLSDEEFDRIATRTESEGKTTEEVIAMLKGKAS